MARFRNLGVLQTLCVVAGLIAAALASVGVQPGTAHAAAACGAPPEAEFSSVVDADPDAAQIWRLYQAHFLRQPDDIGFAYWLGLKDSGLDLTSMAGLFQESEEFQLRYGSLSDLGFVNLIYDNVMCRPYDEIGRNYWVGELGSGLSRPGMLLYFSESEEYLNRTGTRFSATASPSDATFGADGYEIVSVPGGRAIRLDSSMVEVKTSATRCGIASINANWLTPADSANPTPIGLAVIDGVHVPGSADRHDRGVFGVRKSQHAATEDFIWDYEGLFPMNARLGSMQGGQLESWAMWVHPNFGEFAVASEWQWAAAGLPLILGGEVWHGLADISRSDYTHGTYGHSFMMMNPDTGVMMLGSTTGMTSWDLIAYAQASGFSELVKFDGGGSVEFNVGGQVVVAGTPRAIPVWLGVGC